MAQPQRTDPLPAPPPAGPATPSPWALPGEGARTAGGDYAVGGQVGQMHAELAQRLARGLPAAAVAPDTAVDRAVRLLSRAGGYLALAGAYAGIVFWLVR